MDATRFRSRRLNTDQSRSARLSLKDSVKRFLDKNVIITDCIHQNKVLLFYLKKKKKKKKFASPEVKS